jgi:hypothetical protein
MREDQQKTGGVGKPARFNPRANMWRRISSRQAVSFSILFIYLSIYLVVNIWPALLGGREQCVVLIIPGPQIRRCDAFTGRKDVPVAREFLRIPA